MLLNSSELNGSNLNEMRLLAPIYDQAGGPYWLDAAAPDVRQRQPGLGP
jgi:hypothetical protein